LIKRNVEAAPESTIQECGYDIFPGPVVFPASGMVAVIGTKKDVIDPAALGQLLIYVIDAAESYHEQGFLAQHGRVFDFSAPEEICVFVS
jgi:hypothetical protein